MTVQELWAPRTEYYLALDELAKERNNDHGIVELYNSESFSKHNQANTEYKFARRLEIV